jgi:hypothetical protein
VGLAVLSVVVDAAAAGRNGAAALDTTAQHKELRTGCREDGVHEEVVKPFPFFPVRKVRRVLEQHPFLPRCNEHGRFKIMK